MIEIFVVTHKKYKFPQHNIYKPIVAGAYEYEYKSFPEKYIRDDTLINISDKHDLYSEYTVTYWIWKNSNADIVGINHYRRYFIQGNWVSYMRCLLNPDKEIRRLVLDKTIIEKYFNKGIDCIVPKKQWRVNRTLKDEFLSDYPKSLYDYTYGCIQELYPEYLNTFITVMESKENYQKCICIMRKEWFDNYSEWIFSIFNKLEKKGFYGENREFAFLGERLMNVWVEYNKENNDLHIKELFFINVEFPLKNFFKNHTEIILPRFLRMIILVLAKIKVKAEVKEGKFSIKRKR